MSLKSAVIFKDIVWRGDCRFVWAMRTISYKVLIREINTGKILIMIMQK